MATALVFLAGATSPSALGVDFNFSPMGGADINDVFHSEKFGVEKSSTKSKPQGIIPTNNKQEVKPEPKSDDVLVKDIQFEGNRLIDSTSILKMMQMQQGDVYSRDMVQQNLKSIYQMGYFSEKIKAIPISNGDNTITLKIVVQENRPVTDFTIKGNDVVSTEEILNSLTMLDGKPQNISLVNDAIDKIQNLYAEKGYILARVISVSDDPDGVVNFLIDEGYIKSVKFEGNTKTKSFIVERNILTEAGKVYNETLLKQDLMRLYGTQAFRNVTRTIDQDEVEPYKYNITIHLEEQRTGTLSVGGGADTAVGLFGSVGFSDNNFRGLAQRVSLNLLAGTGIMLSDSSMMKRPNLQAELSFFEPNLKNTDNSFMSKIFFRNFASYQVPLSIEQRYGGEVALSRQFKNFQHLTGSIGLGGEYIKVKEGDFNQISRLYAEKNIPISERAKQLTGGIFATISPSLVYDTRETVINPRSGVLASLRFDQAVGLSDFANSHGKLMASIKRYVPVGKKSALTFSARGGGKLYGEMPEVMAYRLGGPYTVRGYQMSAVGTGQGFVVGSAEFLTPIPFIEKVQKMKFLDNVRLAAFVDAGQIFQSSVSDKIYDRPINAITAGVGVRVFIPMVGPLSVDYGFPLINRGKGGSGGALTFGVGEYF